MTEDNKRDVAVVAGLGPGLGGALCKRIARAGYRVVGLAQSLARECGPMGIHVAHVVIDGIIDTPRTLAMMGADPHRRLRADAVADSYLRLVAQDLSAWMQELDLRPDVEPF